MNDLRPGYVVPATCDLIRAGALVIENQSLKTQLETKTAAAIEIRKLLLEAEKEIAKLREEIENLKNSDLPFSEQPIPIESEE